MEHPCRRKGNGNTVGKRSFRRAKFRAVREGRALYKGRWYTVAQLQLQQPIPTGNTSKRQKPLKCIRNAGECRRAGRLKFFSWNSGGLTVGQFDELIAWCETNLFDVIFVQETRWKNEFTWSCGSFLCIHSGENRSGNSWCGLLVLISKRLTNPSMVRWLSVIPGRLLHIRVGDSHGSIDLVNCYQHTVLSQSEHANGREQVWLRLSQLLEALPLRNRLLVAGDWNSPLISRPPWIGSSVPSVSSEVPDVLGDISEIHDLCALNSWTGTNSYTCKTIHGGASCIDAVWTRRCQADPLAKQVLVDHKCPLLASSSACFHVPLSGSIPCLWQCWKHQRQQEQNRNLIDVDLLCQEARACSPRWMQLLLSIQDLLNNYLELDVANLNAKVSSLCACAYPKQVLARRAPATDDRLQSLRNHKWKLWRELQKPGGVSLSALMFRWWLVIRIQALSRESCKRSKKIRRERLDAIYEEARRASTINNMKSLFRQVRRLSPKRLRTRMALRDEHGHLIGPLEEGRRLHKYLTDIYYDAEAVPLAPCHCEFLPFGVEQLTQSIRDLPISKAVPRHCLPSGVWKQLSMVIGPWLHRCLTHQWTRTIPSIPIEWRSSWIILVPKPGKNGSAEDHWRPISLQDSLGKATLKTVTKEARDHVLCDLTCWPQYAYLPGRGTYDAIAKVLLHCEEVRQLLKSNRSTIYDRRDGRAKSDFTGGIQILVDLKGAFDRAPRLLLQQALLDLPLPKPLLSLLLEWHRLTPYHLEHGGQEYVIDSNVGVRQGCVAAPFLWVAFMRLWMKSLEKRFGSSWVRKHLTVYADDNHLAWTLLTLVDGHLAIAEADAVLKSFCHHGMFLNLGKTVAILKVGGKYSASFRRRYVVMRHGQRFLYLSAEMQVPLVVQHVYLGMKVSYGACSAQTLQHRMACGRRSFFALRTWWNPSSLPLLRRINLWKICVYTSLCYSLVETGLAPAQCLTFQRAVYKDLRWIARSPSYITHETNRSLLVRLGMMDPLITLAYDVVRHWSKKWTQARSSSPLDVLQDRWLLLLTAFCDRHHVLLWLQFCFSVVSSTSTEWPHESAPHLWSILKGFGLTQMQNVYDDVLQRLKSEDKPVPDDPDQFFCSFCSRGFSSARGLRVHLTKVHEEAPVLTSPGNKHRGEDAELKSSGTRRDANLSDLQASLQ